MKTFPQEHNEIIAYLPESVRDIAQVLGLPIVLSLVQHFGGVELRIPHKLHPNHKLMILGLEDAQALCEYCPEDTILVPLSFDKKRRKDKVKLLESRGLKRWQIARELGISQRSVRRLANNKPANSNQFDFFQNSKSQKNG